MPTTDFKDTRSLIEHLTQAREKHWLRVGMQRVVWHLQNAEYTWDHQTGGQLPNKDMWRVNRFCVQDIVLGLIALRHDRYHNRIEVDVFLTASIPEYEADSGARALTLMLLSEAYATGSRMEICFTPNVEGGSVHSEVIDLADRLGVVLDQAETGIIQPKEATNLYVALTGFSSGTLDLLQKLEAHGRIAQSQLCYSVHNGVWERVEVEAILSTCPDPGSLLGGKNLPEERHLFLKDLYYGRGAILLGTLDRHLRYRAHPSGGQVALLEDDERSIETNLEGHSFLATFLSPEEAIQVPWVVVPIKHSKADVYSNHSLAVLIRPRSSSDLALELNKDLALAAKFAAENSDRLTYVLVTRDFEKLSAEVRESLIHQCPNGVGLMVYPEFVASMDDEIIRRIRINKGKHK